ncbi:MAG TPA: tRNA pseudouridine(55) synthase TruB [Terriglobia bacterium]|nr:tRNA pseudouridine(55) synthase TruB [Terriglobia bacterium]
MNGTLIIDKPGGMTSHDVVQRVRRLLNTSRVGHLGTLDPMATGVLPLCIGKATRVGQFFATAPKEYIGEIRFGFATTTYDREGDPVDAEKPFTATRDELLAAMSELIGTLDQTPPAYSAKRIGGVRSHDSARRGEAVENAPVRVEVSAFELVEFTPPSIQFRVVCGGGTYVRSLAHDLGKRLGCGAHLTSLRRLQSGDFGIADAVPLDSAGISDITPLDQLFLRWPAIVVSGLEERRVRKGNPIPSEGASGLARILNKQGEFLAVAAVESGWARPRVVLTSETSVEAGAASLH